MPMYRVHELAKEYNIKSSTLIDLLLSAGISVDTHMSKISEKDVEKGRKWVEQYLKDKSISERIDSITEIYYKTLELRNFRCFMDTQISFRDDYSILVGINGSGKTSILDAIAISLGSFLQGLDGVSTNKIHRKDSYRKAVKLGNMVNAEEQYPVSVESVAKVDDREIHWARQMNGVKGTTLKRYAEEMINVAEILQIRIRRGDADILLPLLSYYGTQRLRNQGSISKKKASNINISRMHGYENCLDAVIDINGLSEWFADMTYMQLQEEKEILELEVVRRAMEHCYNMMNDNETTCSIRYKVKTKNIEITTGSEANMPLNYLSDGYKSVLFMVADIAYRMAVLNPHLQKDILLKTPGIVLIDEIDLHLHPSWQKNILQVLKDIFPKVQFIVTTHSPSIIANTKKDHIIILSDHKIYSATDETYGRDTDSILNEIMGVDVRPEEIKILLNRFIDSLDTDIDQAKKYLDEMRNLMGDTAKEVVQGEVALNFERMMAE